MNSSIPSPVDFNSFVVELNQSPQLDCVNSKRGCCAPESRLSEEFENKMLKLLANFDLDDENDTAMAGIPTLKPMYLEKGTITAVPSNDCVLPLSNQSSHHETMDTVVDTDDPIDMTSEECDDSENNDGTSSDEQQHSRSLSLSHSLSISHAPENISQYSQSTDKGLSKRYDSPCSYEEDRESECTNFDKLDDWNDFISDMHNNNNGDAANRDFKEYYDEYLANKSQNGHSAVGVTTNIDEYSSESQERDTPRVLEELLTIEKEFTESKYDKSYDPRPDTPAVTTSAMITENCCAPVVYRKPPCEYEDHPMTSDDNSNSISPDSSFQASGKRKFCYADREEIEYEVTTMIVEKFRKTDVVPDHGSHPPLIADEDFSRILKMRLSDNSTIPEERLNVEEARNDFFIVNNDGNHASTR